MSRLGVLVGFLMLVPSARADWPHVRGPNYDGVSPATGLSASWPKDGPRRIWSRELGQGHSGIVLGGGRLFTQWQSAAGQFLLCLDPATGERLWETRCDRPWQLNGAYPGPYATPTFAGGRVYFASPTGLVGCADADDGRILWTVDVKERFAGRGFNFGYAATPLVEDGRVYLPAGGPDASLVALDAATGATLWKSGGDPASYCPAFPIAWKGRRGIVGYMENYLVVVDAATGEPWHRRRLSSGYDEHSSWPIYREPHLLLASPFKNGATRLRLETSDGEPLALAPDWMCKRLSNDVASSVLVGDAVYGFDLKQLQASAHRPSRGEFRCLDWSTGAVRWSTDRVGHATVLAADGKLFLLGDNGTLILARATPDAYDELGRVTLFEDEVCWTPPALDGGRLYVRSPSRLVCIDVGVAAGPAPSVALPRAARWRVDPSWLLSREREYPNDAPSAAEARLWFAVCLLMMAAAALAAAVCRSPWVFVAVAFALGLIGTNLVSALADRCLFTWPLTAFAALYGATRAGLGGRWRSRLGILGLVATCAAYYFACRAVGMSVAWHYLIGLPVGMPLCAWAIVEEPRRPRWSACLVVLAFAAFFAAGQGLVMWRGS